MDLMLFVFTMITIYFADSHDNVNTMDRATHALGYWTDQFMQ